MAVTFDPANKAAGLTLSNGNLTVSCTLHTTNRSAATTVAPTAIGKKYCEFTIGHITAGIELGLCTSSFPATVDGTILISSPQAYGLSEDGRLFRNSTVANTYGMTLTDGDVVSFLYDGDNHSLEVWKGGVSKGVYTGLAAAAYMPAVSLVDSSLGTQSVSANFGATAFIYTPPAGYVGWDIPSVTVTIVPAIAVVVETPVPSYTKAQSIAVPTVDIVIATATPTAGYTGVPTDLYLSSVVALLHFDGIDGATTFSEFTGKTVTRLGTAQIDTAQSKFGGSSALFLGSGLGGGADGLTLPAGTSWAFGTGDFTLEFWYRIPTFNFSMPLSVREASGYGAFLVFNSTNTDLKFYSSSNIAAWDIANAQAIGAVSVNTWYHVAITRQGNTFRTYLNGVQGSTWTSSAALYTPTKPLGIGSNPDGSYSLNGWLDELRITKGVARYTGAASFTPPTAPFPEVQGVVTIAVSVPTADIPLVPETPAFTKIKSISIPTVDIVMEGLAVFMPYVNNFYVPCADIVAETLAPVVHLAKTIAVPSIDVVVNAPVPTILTGRIIPIPSAFSGLEALEPTWIGGIQPIDVPTIEINFTALIPKFYYLKVQSSVSTSWRIIGRLFSNYVLPWSFRVTTEFSLSYSLHDLVRVAHQLRYSVKNTNRVYSTVEARYSIRLQSANALRWQMLPTIKVRTAHALQWKLISLVKIHTANTASWRLVANTRVPSSTAFVYSLRPVVKVGKALVYNLSQTVHASTVGAYDILTHNKLRKAFTGVWTLTGKSSINVTDQPHLLLNGQRVDIVSGDISTSEGGYAWECNFTVAKVSDYVQFQRGGIFTANLYGEQWTFEVDGKELSRSGPGQVSCRIMGISPSAQFTAPRHTQTDYLWDTPIKARAAAEEVIGTVLDWEIENWTIPAYRLAFTQSDPLSVVKKLAEVAGGIVESTQTGELRIRSLYPVSPKDFDTTAPDHTFVELDDIISVSETYGFNDVFNKFRILDVDQNIQDQMTWVEDYPNAWTGFMRVNPSPWRTAVELVHTGDGTVKIGPPAIKVREMPEEIVEVFKGQGTTSAPIYDLISVVWEATDLGGIVFAKDSSTFTVTGPAVNSVIRIAYHTRSLDYPIVSGTGRPTQFLLQSIPI